MKGKYINISIFILSLICFLISLRLFWNIAVYADGFNTSPDIILGGNLGLIMDWIRLSVLGVLCILSGIKLFKNKN